MAKISPATAAPSDGDRGKGVQLLSPASSERASSVFWSGVAASLKGTRGRPNTDPSRLKATRRVIDPQVTPAGTAKQRPSAWPTSTKRFKAGGAANACPAPTVTSRWKPCARAGRFSGAPSISGEAPGPSGWMKVSGGGEGSRSGGTFGGNRRRAKGRNP